MRILKIDEKHCLIEVIPEIEDDLWHLSQIIEKGDIVKGLTSRKIKGEEGKPTIRKTVFVEIEVEKVSFQRFGSLLRVSGKIKAANNEMLPLGSMQAIEIELNKKCTIIKKSIKRHQIERLRKAQKATRKKPIMLVVLDDEEACIALLKEFGFEVKSCLRSGKSGKQFEIAEWKKEYFGKLAKSVLDNVTSTVVVAGPGFIKNEFGDFLKERGFEGNLFIENTNSAGLAGVNEIIKGNALAKIAEHAEIVKEAMLMEKLLEEIAKDGLATYGTEEVRKAAELGAIAELLIVDKVLAENRAEIEPVMELAEKNRANIHIFNSEHEPGEKLKALGGIAALLRYKVS